MNDDHNKPAPELSETEKAARLNASFDAAGITFKSSRAEVLAQFKQGGREITYRDGVAYTVFDSVELLLSEALTRYALDNRELTDARTLPREGAAGRPGQRLCKSEMDIEQKVAFIRANGADAFERLPLNPPADTSEITTFEQWSKLSAAEKVALIAKDKDIVSKLARTPSERKNGTYVKPGLTEQIRRTHPNLRAPGWSRAALQRTSQ